MNDVYSKIEALCSERGKDITTMCKEAKISRAILSELKMGRTKKLSTDTLAKLAKYFGVSFDYLVERNYPKNMEVFDRTTGERIFPQQSDESGQKEKAPDIGGLASDPLIAFYGDIKEHLSQDDLDDIQTIMKAKAERNKGKKQDELGRKGL